MVTLGSHLGDPLLICIFCLTLSYPLPFTGTRKEKQALNLEDDRDSSFSPTVKGVKNGGKWWYVLVVCPLSMVLLVPLLGTPLKDPF